MVGMQPKLIIEQKITPFANQYAIYQATQADKGQLVAFAQQKRLAFKEKVTFYADEAKSTPIFTFRAEKVMDIHGRFLVEDMDGKLIGLFRKDFGKSLLVSTWLIIDENDTVRLKLAESNQVLAILRRLAEFVPIVGDIVGLVVMFLKYHFRISAADGTEVGIYRKTALFRDHYSLEMTDQAYAAEDWRTLAAQAVALDALQSR